MKYSTTFIDDYVDLQTELDDIIKPETIVQVFEKVSQIFPNRKALIYQDEIITWKEYYRLSNVIAKGFIELGLKNFEGVSILGFNHPCWHMSNMGAILAGGVSVGIYTTNSAEMCQFIISDSNSRIIIVENNEQLYKILSIVDKTKLEAIIVYNDTINEEILSKSNFKDNVYSWGDFMNIAQKSQISDSIMENIKQKLLPNKCSTLIYTSGTTGNPKGVMLSHDNIIWTTKSVCNAVHIVPDKIEKLVSYLPLSHVAAQMMDIYLPLINGGETWFANPDALKGTLVDTLKRASPTVFFGVPRVWEKMMEGIQVNAKNISGLKKVLGTDAKKISLQRFRNFDKGENSTPFKWYIYDKLVYKKIKKRLGLSTCKLFITGAAPISKETIEFFASLDIYIYDIYGMSECSGPMTISYPGSSKLSSSGKKIPGTEILIHDETTEICTRGRHVMMGYLNQVEKTEEAIDKNGWLRSGDMGKVNNDGYLFITGRIKELIVTAGGENIPPILIEDNIKAELPIISNCMLVGDKMKYLVILLTIKCKMDPKGFPTNELDSLVLDELQKIGSPSLTVKDILNDQVVHKYIQEGIDCANKKSISKAQIVQKFTILDHDFSIPTGELGPTLKLKRPVVLEKYKDIIEEMYQETVLAK